MAATTSASKWKSPDIGTLKCNVDAALSQREAQIGYGFIIRNRVGELVVAKNGKIPDPKEAIAVEALGV